MYQILTETTSIDPIVLTMIEPGEKPDLIINGFGFKVKSSIESSRNLESDYHEWMKEKGAELMDEYNHFGEGLYNE